MTLDRMRSLLVALRTAASSVSNQQLGLAIAAAVDITLGIALLAGDPARVGGPSFETAKMFAPLETWALFIGGFGVLILAALALQTRLTPVHGRIAIGVPCALAAGWHTWWATSFAVTAHQRADAALTGIFAYAGYALLHLMVAMREEG